MFNGVVVGLLSSCFSNISLSSLHKRPLLAFDEGDVDDDDDEGSRSVRRANSSPGANCFSHIEHRKQLTW